MRYLLPFLVLFIDVNSYCQNALSANITNAHSPTCGNGAIDLHINEGYANYEIQWYKNGVLFGPVITTSGSDGLEDLPNVHTPSILPGSYQVEVTDALCGKADETFSVGILSNPIKLLNRKINSYCADHHGGYYASGDGELHIQVNFLGSYSLSWTGPSGPLHPIDPLNLTMLCAGAYTVTITMGPFGCQQSRIFNICCCDTGEPTRTTGCNLEGEMPSCYTSPVNPIHINEGDWGSQSAENGCNGFIAPEFIGGGSNLTYSWSYNGNSFVGNTPSLYSLCAGTYCVTVSDGCSNSTRCWTLIDCTLDPIIITGVKHNCCGELNNGFVELSVTGGTPEYDFSWSNGSTSQNILNLSGGLYCVTVSDQNNCSASTCFNVLTLPAIEEESEDPCGTWYTCLGEQIFVPSEPENILDFQGPVEWIENELYTLPDILIETIICHGEILGFDYHFVNITPVSENGSSCYLNITVGDMTLFGTVGELILEYDETRRICKKKCQVLIDSEEYWPNTHENLAFIYEWPDEAPQTTYVCTEKNVECTATVKCFGVEVDEYVDGCDLCNQHLIQCCLAFTNSDFDYSLGLEKLNNINIRENNFDSINLTQPTIPITI